METSIQISRELLEKLKNMKISDKESYENLIWDLIEDRMELNEQTKKRILMAEKDVQEGRIHKWGDVKRELSIDV
jgi:predicted CopG family antitoxin|tara:strand:+ start:983 stop:1207 length:225 start_codon:yes stop_codon:yes gene_type:complete